MESREWLIGKNEFCRNDVLRLCSINLKLSKLNTFKTYYVLKFMKKTFLSKEEARGAGEAE